MRLPRHTRFRVSLLVLAGGAVAFSVGAQAAVDVDCAKAKALETKAYETKAIADFRAAAAALEHCSQERPGDQSIHRSLGYLYLDNLHEPNKALPHLKAVYEATPSEVGWSQMYARDLGDLGQTNLQIQVLQGTTKRHPGDPWSRLDLARALEKAGRYAEAAAAYQAAQKDAPDDQWVNMSYARFLESRGRDDEAEAVAKRVVASHQQSAPALTLLGDIYQDNADFAGAQAQYARAMLAAPGSSGAKAGLASVQVSREPQLKTSDYAFHGTDHFLQTELYNTVNIPVQDRMMLHASFNSGYFANPRSAYPDVERYEEGVGLGYTVNRTLSLDAGATGFEVHGHAQAGFEFATTWRPTRDFWVYGDYRYHDPINDSIATVADGLTQNVGGVNFGYQITDSLSATVSSSRADYSDGNTRNFIHVEPATFMFYRPLQLQAGPVYEVIDYQIQKANYGSPSWYQIVGPMIELEPQVNEWLSIKARAEAAYVARGAAWGAIIVVGPSLHFGKTFDLTAQYLYYDLPGSYTDYAGQGFQAALNWRF